MPANPRVVTLGDMVYARDAEPGDILVLDKDLVPVWTSLEELTQQIVAALVKAGKLKP